MPSHIYSSLSDGALLLAIQSGNNTTGDALYCRLTPLIIAMIKAARPQSRTDFRHEVCGEVMRMIVDPNVMRFQSARGNTKQYLLGLVKNATRIIENQRKPVCINLGVKPVGDDVKVSRSDAGVVHHNAEHPTECPMVENTLIHRELADLVLAPEDLLTRTAVRMHFMDDIPVSTVAKNLKINRFALARRLKRFCADASQRLALAGAA